MLNKIKQAKEVIISTIKSIFTKETLDELARKSGFVRRSTSKLTGSELIEVLTIHMLDDPKMSYDAMCDAIFQINPAADLKPQSLEERINKQETVTYVKSILEEAISRKISSIVNSPSNLFNMFVSVDIRDSTIISLNQKLADNFKGSGGNASTSAVKVDAVYNIKDCQLKKITLHEGCRPDQSLSNDGSHTPVAGSLQINDLGYFSLEQFASWEKNGVYHLSRLSSSVNVYLSEDDNEAINLPSYLNKTFTSCNVIDLRVFLGSKEKLPTRLVIYRLPQEIVSERRRKANTTAKKKGRTPTKEHMEWLGFAFFTTNVPQEVWLPEVIGTVYRIRWQIELIFKTWKSLLHIDILKGTRPERIQCVIYARLLCIVLITHICSYAAAYAWETNRKEVSPYKVISMLLRKYRVSDLLSNPDKILLQIEFAIARLCKQTRNRKTTLELIEMGTGYLETLAEKIQSSADGRAAENP